MRRMLCTFLVLALLTGGIGPIHVPAATAAQTAGATIGDSGDRAADTDSAIGVLAAAGCGLFTRLTIITAGTQVGIIAGAVACCLLMLVDCAADKPPAK
ncbi:MAG TPA: hypothetical protein VMS88_02870 [Terriglobales bacterium]|nr:hypothetical protein [Terriglobales bacterium]